MEQKRHIAFWIIFPIVFLLLSALTIFYLDLANGPIWTLIVAIVGLVVVLGASIVLLNRRILVRCTPWLVGGLVVAIAVVGAKPAVERKGAVNYANPQEAAVLTIRDGKVKGVYNKEGSVAVYAGIPYAEVPKRWAEPTKPTPWTDVKDCSYFAPRSYQPNNNPVMDSLVDIYAERSWHPDFTMRPVQDKAENSLALNVWKPIIDTVDPLPVLVYIHGGSLTNGSSAFDDYNGETFAEHGVVMVTISYRLGVFGYFAHPSLASESPNGTTGNYGLLDQIEALKWVKENISYFQGDPNNVTIAGESAGSSSVSALCASPLAKGLFKNAIGESSSLVTKEAPHTFRSMEEAQKTGNKILKEFGCKDINELRNVPAEKLVNTKYSNSSMTIDGYALPKTPYEVYEAGESNETNLLNGYNVKESDAFVVPQYLFSPTNKGNIKERLTKYFGAVTAEKFMAAYAEQIEKDAFSAFNEIISAYWFIEPHHSWSKEALKEGKTVYRYQFTKENGYYGTYHSGEMIYAFGNIGRSYRQFAYDDSDRALSKTMVSYWTNFIKTGNPNGEGVPTWDPYVENGSVQELGSRVGAIADRYASLYPIIAEYVNLPPDQKPPREEQE